MRRLFAPSFFFFLVSCSPGSLSRPASVFDIIRENENNLTQEYAVERAAQVGPLSYKLDFTFGESDATFSGVTTMDVVVRDFKKPLSIDASLASIKNVVVNGVPLRNYTYREGSFDIPAEALRPQTTIEISYTGKFSEDGEGLMRFEDPQDKAVYLYSNFEPYGAHKVFPCLDQPDLKARFEVSMILPKTWQAIGNSAEKSSEDASTTTRLVRFNSTQPISTYLVFVGAGDYQKWESKAGNIPLSLYARKSLARHIDAENIFSITAKGLDWFQEYFGVAYPFEKYDQIFSPELSPGAMENPGAVTLNERMVFQDTPTTEKVFDRTNTILHEMAHMWFGDLVTMKWWNDLWLNESFATYVSTLAQARAFDGEAAWESFFWEKTWGYWQDGLSTTHPIETDVPNTDVAMTNFDGITYAKGAATLKQLHFYLGEEAFRSGISSYFKEYAWKNTEQKHFMGSLEKASGIDLAPWTKSWLQSAGTHKIETNWECTDNKVSKFEIVQHKNASGQFSPHHTSYAFLEARRDGKVTVTREASVTFDGAITNAADLVGLPCPDAVFPNYNDYDFADYAIDERSLGVLTSFLPGINHNLTRAMAWYRFGEMARNGDMSVANYLNLFRKHASFEAAPSILAGVVGRHSALADIGRRYLTKEQRLEMTTLIDDVLYQNAFRLSHSEGIRGLYLEAFLNQASSKEGIAKLKYLLENGSVFGTKLSQPQRWVALKAMARAGHEEALTLIEKESAIDTSHFGKRNAAMALASIPTLSNKETHWQAINAEDTTPAIAAAMAEGFQNPGRSDLMEPFVDRYFHNLISIDWSKNYALAETYLENLFPIYCDAELLEISEALLAKHKSSLNTRIVRGWFEANDELRKCVKALSQ